MTAVDAVDATGAFKRRDAGYRHIIEVGGRFEPEPERYHLYVSLACPWAHGTLIALKMKGPRSGEGLWL
jgi:putative glutathione S-transferase